MFRNVMTLGKIFGITIQLHVSWWFVLVLLSWSLATTYFPQYYAGMQMSWLMGIAAAVLLFVSVLLHELSHSLVARAKKIKVETITLFFFGGVAGIRDEEPSTEFLMAIAGPLFSLVLAGFFLLLSRLDQWWMPVVLYLFQLNLILAIFNLIPGFPLDGGRAFRALLYGYYKDILKATKIAVTVGKIFAGLLIAMGFIGFITGTGQGLWFIFLGGFLYFLAGASYTQVRVRETLHKIPLTEVMTSTLTQVKASMSIADFVDSYGARSDDAFVVQSKNDLRLFFPARARNTNKVGDGAISVKKLFPLSLHDTAYTAFQRATELGVEALPVMEGKRLVGVVSRRVLLRRLYWKGVVR